MTPPIELAVFDLAGTTVADDSGVGQCLLDAAREYEVPATLEQIMRYLGTNKIHLYQFLIAQAAGRDVQIEDFDDTRQVDETYAQAKQMYDRFTELMIEYYRRGVKEIPGAADTFRWCHDHGIKVATNTGFHRDVTEALMDGARTNSTAPGSFGGGRGGPYLTLIPGNPLFTTVSGSCFD
jgi:beta-phosphoglucomutase-like phosphatase (HAD superfamily)